jgi:hypothetical protein
MTSASSIRIGAVMVVQNDAETVERSLASFYPFVERLVVSTDPKRGWSGAEITPDDSMERIRSFDKDGKVDILTGDFCRYTEPMKNDTFQRQTTADRLNAIVPGLDWVVQIDADEEFLNFGFVRDQLSRLPRRIQTVSWRWIQLYQQLDDGRYLVVVNSEGAPILEQFAFAHRPDATLASCRFPRLPSSPLIRRLLGLEYIASSQMDHRLAALHFSFAKSEKRIHEKLRTWSHAHDFDTETYFALWKRAKTDWADLRNIHPTYPTAWPALKPYTLEELKRQR